MIANISPASINFSETLSTLKFAQRAKLITNKALINEESSGSIEVLKAEITRLKKELECTKVSINNNPSPYDNQKKFGVGGFSQEAIEEHQKELMEMNRNQIELESLLTDSMIELASAESKYEKITALFNEATSISKKKELQLKMMVDLYEEKLRRISFNNWYEEDQKDSLVKQNVNRV